MSGLQPLISLAGTWTGHNQVFLPDEPPHESTTSAVLRPVAGGKFVQISYTWAYDGAEQDGILLIGYETADQVATAVWLDSWHMGEKTMTCRGTLSAGGGVDVQGSYSVEGSPEWGWRIVVEPQDASLHLRMYNISPDEQSYPAVEATYQRAA